MSAPITVLTVTIPGREQLLAENLASVYAQTVPVQRQLICAHLATTTEQPMVQYSRAKNEMLAAVDTDWIAVLNDDDVWLSHHVETVAPYLDEADVISTWEASGSKPRVDYSDWSQEQLVAHFDETNELDGNCLIRLSLLESVGGFPTDWEGPGPHDGGHYKDSLARWEDWALFQRLAPIGARFRCVPVETWRYGKNTPGQICG